jgi:hypothetical protein
MKLKRREIWVARQYQLLEFTFHGVRWFQSSMQGSMVIRRKVELGFCVKSEEWLVLKMLQMDLFTVSFEKSYNTNEVSPNLSFNPLKYKVHLTTSFKIWSLPTKQATNQLNNGTHSIWRSWGSFVKKSPAFYEYAGYRRVQKSPPPVLIPSHISSWRSVLILSSHLHLGLPMISFWYVLFQTHRKDYDKGKMFNVIDRNNNCWLWKSRVKDTYSVGKKNNLQERSYPCIMPVKIANDPLYTCIIQLERRSTDLHEI